MNFRIWKTPSHILSLNLRAGVPADAPEKTEQAGCRHEDLFLDRFDGEGACTQHAARCQNHADAQSSGRPQGMQRERNAEQAVQINHVWSGGVGGATQRFEPPCVGDRGTIGDLDAFAHVGDVGLNALKR